MTVFDITNNEQYNLSIAKEYGILTAVYLTEIIRQCKNSPTPFAPDEQEIIDRIAMAETDQHKAKKKLISIGILDKVDDDKVSFSQNGFLNLFACQQVELAKQETPRKKRTKEEVKLDNLKSRIATANAELYSAYCSWIKAVLDKDGWMAPEAVVQGQNAVDNASNRNLDVALHIISIATINGYRDMSWAVNVYNKEACTMKNISYSSTVDTTITYCTPSSSTAVKNTGEKIIF